jgi:protein gp37
MGKTSIEWTDASWNPIVGCTEISPGCANCYAARLAATRLKNTPQYKDLAVIGTHIRGGCDQEIQRDKPRWTEQLRVLPERLNEPLDWRKPRRIFVCDMGDLFHEAVGFAYIVRIFDVMMRCQAHTFQILTKRAERMQQFFRECSVKTPWPLPNVWLGVSVENQHFADARIPLLLATPAAVRWISAEPLLGPVDLAKACEVSKHPQGLGRRLDWIVCGGESGPNARPMALEWARSLRDQCQAAAVPFFFKQWGAWRPAFDQYEGIKIAGHNHGCCQAQGSPLVLWNLGKHRAGRLLDGREWNEFPKRVMTP